MQMSLIVILVMLSNVLQRSRTVMYEQHNSGIPGSAASYANLRTAADNFFPDWEHVNPLHDRLIKKTEVSELQSILTSL